MRRKFFIIFGILILALSITGVVVYADSLSKNTDSTTTKDEITDMITIMNENGFADMSDYMQNGDIDAMDEYMNDLTEEEFNQMIELMRDNGFDDMADLMESYGIEGMNEMHEAMSGDMESIHESHHNNSNYNQSSMMG